MPAETRESSIPLLDVSDTIVEFGRIAENVRFVRANQDIQIMTARYLYRELAGTWVC